MENGRSYTAGRINRSSRIANAGEMNQHQRKTDSKSRKVACSFLCICCTQHYQYKNKGKNYFRQQSSDYGNTFLTSIGSCTDQSGIVVLRYADVLLMKAEALNEQALTTDAEAPLYEVRKRAGLTNRADIEGLTQDQMREKIIQERRIELAFEGDRWFDLVRLKDNYALKFLHSIGKTNAAEKHLLMPIPLKEIEANGNLKQNPGY